MLKFASFALGTSTGIGPLPALALIDRGARAMRGGAVSIGTRYSHRPTPARTPTFYLRKIYGCDKLPKRS